MGTRTRAIRMGRRWGIDIDDRMDGPPSSPSVRCSATKKQRPRTSQCVAFVIAASGATWSTTVPQGSGERDSSHQRHHFRMSLGYRPLPFHLGCRPLDCRRDRVCGLDRTLAPERWGSSYHLHSEAHVRLRKRSASLRCHRHPEMHLLQAWPLTFKDFPRNHERPILHSIRTGPR